MKQQQIMQQQLLEEVGEQNFCNLVFEKPELFIFLLFVQWQNTEYRHGHSPTMANHCFSFFIFSIRSWNQDKDKFWICFLLSITKRIGLFSTPNMKSKYLPFFRWALHEQTSDETWLVIYNKSWLATSNKKTWLVIKKQSWVVKLTADYGW